MRAVRVSAKNDYAIRAAVELAAAWDEDPVKAERIADAQGIPVRFLTNILAELRHGNLVESRRGADGGYRLARPPDEIAVADIIRAVDGPLANVGGLRPEQLDYRGREETLRDMWVALRANIRAVLEAVTLADLAGGALPDQVRALTDDEDAWVARLRR